MEARHAMQPDELFVILEKEFRGRPGLQSLTLEQVSKLAGASQSHVLELLRELVHRGRLDTTRHGWRVPPLPAR